MVELAVKGTRAVGRTVATLGHRLPRLKWFADGAMQFASAALIAAVAAAASSLGLSERAFAPACGPPDAGGSVTCPTTGNPYAGGINYSTPNTPLTVILAPGVVVVANPGVSDPVNLQTTTAADPANTAGTLIANDAAV
jgi:hypothetical protein